jgi:DNA helicase II / ATP-dependent DNA helicase PcrA
MRYNLSRIQQEIVDHNEGPLLVKAGPGSGKTRVLTERVRRLILQNNAHFKVLCLTFTNKAANEMMERLEDINNFNESVYIGTIHNFCYAQLQSKGNRVGITGSINLFEKHQDRIQILYQSILKNDHSILGINFRNERQLNTFLNMYLAKIHDFKNSFIPPEYVKDSTDRSIYEWYNSELRNSNAIDYDDILFLTYRLFCENPKILDLLRRQFGYICIDEAQDLNQAQYLLIKLLFDQTYNNIMMVGDPNQAIFTWNGASSKFMEQFENDYKPVVKILNENYRCSQTVVKLSEKLTDESTPYGTLPIVGDSKLIVGKDEQDEALKVLDFIENLIHNGHKEIEGKVTLEDCAIIARNRYVFLKIKDLFDKQNIKYQYVLTSQNDFESDLIKDFDLCLRILANPKDQLHFSLLCKRWKLDNLISSNEFKDSIDVSKLIGNLTQNNQNVILNSIKEISRNLPQFELTGAIKILKEYSDTFSDAEERLLVREDISDLQQKYNYYLRSGDGSSHLLSTFLSQLALDTSAKYTQNGISLLTVHSAKGLEFNVVVIMGLVEGVFPDYRAIRNGDEAIKEEQREAFVSVTRSKRIIAFSYPQLKMMPWGDEKPQIPSRFLKQMGLIPGR